MSTAKILLMIVSFSELYSSQQQHTPKNSRKKNKQQKYFGESNRSLRRPNIGHIPDCSQWIDLKPASVDNTIYGTQQSQPCNLPEGTSLTSESQHFPSAPQVPYPQYLGQVAHT